MNIEEFGKQIKTKYPQYSNIPDKELGEKMVSKYPQYQSLIGDKSPEVQTKTDTFLSGHPVLKGISDFVGTTGMAKGIAQGIFLKFTPEGKNLLKMIEDGQLKESDVEKFMGKTATTKEILASAAQTALTVGSFGSSKVATQPAGQFLKTAGKSALKTGALIGTGSAVSEYGKGGTTQDVVKAGATGFGIGAGFSVLGSALKAVISKTPSLLSLTSEVPEGVLQRSAERPSAMAEAGKYVKNVGEKQILKETQAVVPQLRKSLTNQWNKGKEQLINEFGEKRVGFGDSEEKAVKKVLEQFGHDIPQNLKDMSFSEVLELNKTLNAIKSGSLEKSPEGYIVRKLSDVVRNKLVKNFGGAGGKTEQFLGDYASRKRVLDSFNILVDAYNTNNPKKMSTALSALKSVFKENKGAYIDSFSAMEKAIGKPLLDKVAALTTQRMLPRKLGEFGINELFRLLLAPITTERGASFLARQSGRVAQSGSGAVSTIAKGLAKTTAKQ